MVKSLVQEWALLLICCVVLGKSPSLSVPQVPQLWDECLVGPPPCIIVRMKPELLTDDAWATAGVPWGLATEERWASGSGHRRGRGRAGGWVPILRAHSDPPLCLAPSPQALPLLEGGAWSRERREGSSPDSPPTRT